MASDDRHARTQPSGRDSLPPERAHHVDHAGHEAMFRRRFWVCLPLSLPVLFFSASMQGWLDYAAPSFSGSDWVTPVLAVFVFLYGGLPFLQMAWPELLNRKPGMMTLISLAISVAFVYSMAALFMPGAEGFFWELVTLIDIMLLGHWLEMRSVRQASGALTELARLLPDIAERIGSDGQTEEVAVGMLAEGDLLLVRPGASVPADGVVEEGESEINEAMITGESKPVEKATGQQVTAGTINGDGSIRVRVTATGDRRLWPGSCGWSTRRRRANHAPSCWRTGRPGWLFYVAVAVAFVTAIAWSVAGASAWRSSHVSPPSW